MSRVFSFIKKNCNNKIPISSNLDKSDEKFLNNLKDKLPTLIAFMDEQKLNDYIKMVASFLLTQINTLMTRTMGN